jgi:hypothetical protein
MTKITYEIVEHDGGWANRIDGVFSETFPSHDMARRAAEPQQRNKSSRETRQAFRTRTRMAIGTTKYRQAMIDPRPTSRAEGSLRRRSAPAPTPSSVSAGRASVVDQQCDVRDSLATTAIRARAASPSRASLKEK